MTKRIVRHIVTLARQTPAVRLARFVALFIGRVRKIAKSDYWLRQVCLSLCQHETNQHPLDGFS